jgi:hypothetical protein
MTFFVVPGSGRPTALISPTTQRIERGVFVPLNGRGSTDPTNDSLTYVWRFISKPATSQLVDSDFISTDDDFSSASFLPDTTGHYVVGLVVNDGALDSIEAEASVEMNYTVLPYGEGDIPDASFVWKTISSFWSIVEGREGLTTIFSAAIQIIASQILRLYQNDFCKAILEIPGVIQRRWLAYSSRIDLDPTQHVVYLGDQMYGTQASAGIPGFQGTGATNSDNTEFLIVGRTGSVTPAAIGRTLVILDNTNSNAGRYTIKAINTTRTGYKLTSDKYFTTASIAETFRIETFPEDKTNVIYVPTSEANLNSIVNPAGRLIWLEGRCYLIVRTFIDNTSFTVPMSEVVISDAALPAQASMLRWRIPCMVRSGQADFDILGLTEGDILEFEVQAFDRGVSISTAPYQCLVVGALGTRLGFVPSTDPTYPTEPTAAEIEAFAQSIGISTEDVNGVSPADIFEADARAVGGAFQTTYFHTPLANDQDIMLSGVPFRIKTRYVRRLRKVLVDSSLVSVPQLQEKIIDPDPQYQENEDFYIDGPDTIIGEDGKTEINTGEFTSPSALFLEREALPGDTLRVEDGVDLGDFKVIRVMDEHRLLVWPNFTATDTNVGFKLLRQNRNTYLRFSPLTFTALTPPPDRLWADVSYFDSSLVVEENFGNKLDYPIRDHVASAFGGTYRDVVTALLYTAMTGPTPENLRRATQGVMGLPMTSSRGRIVEIEEDYKLHHRTGQPFIGRLALQDMDNHVDWDVAKDYPEAYLGSRSRVYYYPALQVGKELYTGLAYNPETGLRYAEGDVVERFSLLSLGVQYADYLSDPSFWMVIGAGLGLSSGEWEIQKFHHFAIRVLAELVASSDQMDMLKEIMDRARPGYTNYDLAIVAALSDEVTVTDELYLNFTYLFTDNPCWSMETSYSWSLPNGRGDIMYVAGKGFLSTRVVNHNADLSIIAGTAHTSVDLSHVKIGDHLLLYHAPYAGRYRIDSLTSGGDLTLSQLAVAWPETCPDPTLWPTASGLLFTIQRELKNPISETTEAVTWFSQALGITTFQLNENTPELDGVTVGDYLSVEFGTGATLGPYEVHSYDLVTQRISSVSSLPNAALAKLTFCRRIFEEEQILEIDNVVGNTVELVASEIATLGIHRKERVELLDSTGALVSTHLIVDLSPSLATLFLVPAPVLGALVPYSIRVIKPYPSGALTLLETDCPRDDVAIDRVPGINKPAGILIADTVTGNPGGLFFTSDLAMDFGALGVLPGDEIEVSSGAGGVYYIWQVAAAQLDVTSPPTADANLAYTLRRRD